MVLIVGIIGLIALATLSNAQSISSTILRSDLYEFPTPTGTNSLFRGAAAVLSVQSSYDEGQDNARAEVRVRRLFDSNSMKFYEWWASQVNYEALVRSDERPIPSPPPKNNMVITTQVVSTVGVKAGTPLYEIALTNARVISISLTSNSDGSPQVEEIVIAADKLKFTHSPSRISMSYATDGTNIFLQNLLKSKMQSTIQPNVAV